MQLNLCYGRFLYSTNNDENFVYEFTFTNNIDDCSGKGWNIHPLYKFAELPNKEFITKSVKVEMNIDLIFPIDDDDSDTFYKFTYYEVCDKIIALCWENSDVAERLVYHYGIDYDNFIKKLDERCELDKTFYNIV
jgi:hypothetical protein